MKKLLLTLTLLAGTVFGQTTATLSNTGASSVYPGATVNLNLNLVGSSGQNIAGLQFTHSNNLLSGATLTLGVGPASTTATKGLYCTTVAPVVCLLTGDVSGVLSNLTYSDGVVETIQFVVPASTPVGVQSLSLTNLVAASLTGSSVPFTFPTPLSLTVLSFCDLNGDGVTNAADVLMAVNESLGNQTCADTLGNSGGCNAVFVERIVTAATGGACKTGL